jgi:hypothetical protein
MIYRGLLSRRRAYPTLNTHIQPKGHAMKKVYIGIDAHKESNTVALAFAGSEPPELYGKVSADLSQGVIKGSIKGSADEF